MIFMLITALGPTIRGVQRLMKVPDNSKLIEDVYVQTKNTRDLAHKLALDPLNLLNTPVTRIFKALETFDNKIANINKVDTKKADKIKLVSRNLFEAIYHAIANRIQIMDKLPEMKTSLEEIFNKEKDPAKKLAVELLEELRSVQGESGPVMVISLLIVLL